VQIRDTSGANPALDGDNRFNRFNPAAGATYKASEALTAYANYNEGMRIPTPVELTCANPSAPCALPNAFSPTRAEARDREDIEAGLRGRIAQGANWRATAYQTTLTDDITVRERLGGVAQHGLLPERRDDAPPRDRAGSQWNHRRLNLAASYAYIDARFAAASPSTARTTRRRRERRHPGQPRRPHPRHPQNVFKLRGAWRAGDSVDIGAGMIAAGASSRGNENNQDSRGRVAGYAVFNLDARWRFARGWELFAEIDNLFNTRYETVGLLGRNFFNGPGRSFDANAAASDCFSRPGAVRRVDRSEVRAGEDLKAYPCAARPLQRASNSRPFTAAFSRIQSAVFSAWYSAAGSRCFRVSAMSSSARAGSLDSEAAPAGRRAGRAASLGEDFRRWASTKRQPCSAARTAAQVRQVVHRFARRELVAQHQLHQLLHQPRSRTWRSAASASDLARRRWRCASARAAPGRSPRRVAPDHAQDAGRIAVRSACALSPRSAPALPAPRLVSGAAECVDQGAASGRISGDRPDAHPSRRARTASRALSRRSDRRRTSLSPSTRSPTKRSESITWSHIVRSVSSPSLSTSSR